MEYFEVKTEPVTCQNDWPFERGCPLRVSTQRTPVPSRVGLRVLLTVLQSISLFIGAVVLVPQ